MTDGEEFLEGGYVAAGTNIRLGNGDPELNLPSPTVERMKELLDQSWLSEFFNRLRSVD